MTDAKDKLASVSTDSRHRVVDATHAGVVGGGVTFASSIPAVAEVVRWTRNNGTNGHPLGPWADLPSSSALFPALALVMAIPIAVDLG